MVWWEGEEEVVEAGGEGVEEGGLEDDAGVDEG